MSTVLFCPLVGGKCNKNEPDIRIQLNTCFLAEPFKPDEERKRREKAIKLALKEQWKENYKQNSLRIADAEPAPGSIFCDICKKIQSSAYGIVDITGLNPNVLLELGMMLALGKPVTIIFRRDEEASLRVKLPSDIIWKRVIPYQEFIDVHDELCEQIQSCQVVLNAQLKKMPDDPASEEIFSKFQTMLEDFRGWIEKEKLISRQKIDIDPSIPIKIEEISKRVNQVEQLLDFPGGFKDALLKGNYYLNEGMCEQAIQMYDRSLKLNPRNVEALNNMGNAYRKLGKYDRAIEFFDKALSIEPDASFVLINKGVTIINMQKADEAIECFDQVLEIDPYDEIALFNKGCALAHLGKHQEAIASFDKVLKIKPKDPEALLYKAEELILFDKTEDGLEVAKKAKINAKCSTDKAIALLLETYANVLLNKADQIQRKKGEFKKLIKDLESREMFDYNLGFSFIEKAAAEENPADRYKQKFFSMIDSLKNYTS